MPKTIKAPKSGNRSVSIEKIENGWLIIEHIETKKSFEVRKTFSESEPTIALD